MVVVPFRKVKEHQYQPDMISLLVAYVVVAVDGDECTISSLQPLKDTKPDRPCQPNPTNAVISSDDVIMRSPLWELCETEEIALYYMNQDGSFLTQNEVSQHHTRSSTALGPALRYLEGETEAGERTFIDLISEAMQTGRASACIVDEPGHMSWLSVVRLGDTMRGEPWFAVTLAEAIEDAATGARQQNAHLEAPHSNPTRSSHTKPNLRHDVDAMFAQALHETLAPQAGASREPTDLNNDVIAKLVKSGQWAPLWSLDNE